MIYTMYFWTSRNFSHAAIGFYLFIIFQLYPTTLDRIKMGFYYLLFQTDWSSLSVNSIWWEDCLFGALSWQHCLSQSLSFAAARQNTQLCFRLKSERVIGEEGWAGGGETKVNWTTSRVPQLTMTVFLWFIVDLSFSQSSWGAAPSKRCPGPC
jgi:hypothetical protein